MSVRWIVKTAGFVFNMDPDLPKKYNLQLNISNETLWLNTLIWHIPVYLEIMILPSLNTECNVNATVNYSCYGIINYELINITK